MVQIPSLALLLQLVVVLVERATALQAALEAVAVEVRLLQQQAAMELQTKVLLVGQRHLIMQQAVVLVAVAQVVLVWTQQIMQTVLTEETVFHLQSQVPQ